MNRELDKNRYIAAVLGLVVGDALGVPAEFKSRAELKENPVTDMIGYVVDTLEAAIWCFLNTENYKDYVLKVVNLGYDTDTVGAVAGGLAGLYYRIEGIPEEWIEILLKRGRIIELAGKMRRN